MNFQSDPKKAEPPDELAYSYWRGTFIIRGSVAPRIFLEVLGFGLLAAIIVFMVQQLEMRFGIDLSVPAGPLEAAGAVLGLLLVLRVNTGYSRWWEARVLWGGIVNQSRNLAIIGLAYGPKDMRWRSRFIRWIAVFPHVIRRSLRFQRVFPELESLLSTESREWLERAEHMPGAVSSEIALLLAEARSMGMDGYAFLRAEEQRSQLVDHLGACERILRTPLARSGAIQVRQFIFLFLATLPLGLMEDFQLAADVERVHRHEVDQIWLVTVYVILLAYPLLSLDRIGMELQNPFSTQRIDFLPLDSICTTIERNVLELLQDFENQKAAAPQVADVKLPPDAPSVVHDDDLPANIS